MQKREKRDTQKMTMAPTTTNGSSKDISPTITSGVPRMKGYMMVGVTTLTLGYVSLVYALQDSGSYLTPADVHCSEAAPSEICSRPDLFAFQIVPGLAMLLGAASAFWTWHISRRVHDALPATPEGRLFGYLPESEQLAAASLTFQVWDFFTSLSIAEHCTPM
jgi:hypothetical protein